MAPTFFLDKPMVSSITGETVVNQGDTLQLTCQTRGVPTPAITWSLNDRLLEETSDGQVFFPTANSLQIKFMSNSYVGTYTCTASNTAGRAQQSVDVYVQGKNTNSIV